MDVSRPRSPRRASLALAALLVALAAHAGPHAVARPEEATAVPTPLTAAELDELVAPVALYPDVLLDSLLPATAAPGDVVDAARFVASQGGTVAAPPADVAWDVGVVAMLQFPDVLQWMGDNPAWVERVGFAVATQPTDVLAAVQRYRTKARVAGVLASDARATVTVDPTSVIVIRSTSPDVIYVPVYDAWALDGWSPGRPFYRSWFSFSFGALGTWGYHRIVWGRGIYGYDDPWWGGRWRNPAADWGTARPWRWTAARRVDQPWRRTGWVYAGGSVRPVSPRTATAGLRARTVTVAPPSRRDARGSPRVERAPTATIRVRSPQPLAPAAPITRWSRTGGVRTTVPPAAAPRVVRRPVLPTPPARVLAPAPRFPSAPAVVDRAATRDWSQRGRRSLGDGGLATPAPTVPRVVVPPVPRFVPRAPPAVAPAPRAFSPARLPPPALDTPRVRAVRQRGHRSLTGS